MSYRENFAAIDWSVPLPEVYTRKPLPDRRSKLPGPMVISDTMDPTQCMANGKIYDSKSAMSRAHRALGFVEIGNEKGKPPPRKRTNRKEVRDALQKAEARYNRGERTKP